MDGDDVTAYGQPLKTKIFLLSLKFLLGITYINYYDINNEEMELMIVLS